MQLGTSTLPLLPAVAVGVAVVLAGLVLWGVHRVRRAPGALPQDARTDDRERPEPEARDWTGEGAGGAADPPRPARRPTVADAVAARGADTEPIAAVTVATPPTAWGAGPAPDRPEPPPSGPERDRPGPPPAAGTPPTGPPRGGHHRLAGQGPSLAAADDRPDAPRPVWRWVPRHASADDLAPAASEPDGRVELDTDGDVPVPPDTTGAPSPASNDPADGHGSPDALSDDDRAAPVRAGTWSAFGSGAGDRSPGDAARRDEARSGPATSAPGATASEEVAASGSVSSGSVSSGAVPSPGDDPRVLPESDTSRAGEVGSRDDVPDLDEDTDGTDGPESVGTGPVPPPWSPARSSSAAGPPEDPDPVEPAGRSGVAASAGAAGPSEPVSFAVAQALAARAVQRARGRADVPDLAADDVPPSLPDARDRLLSVLLTDPATALGATTDLDDTRERIDRLGDVLRRRRADLATAVRRLHSSGLTGEQIGQLAGLDRDDVREILEQASGEGGGGR